MYLVYHPAGQDEPTRWKYDPNKLMSPEQELLEKLTGLTYAEVTKGVIKGSALCRRALLFVYLKRSHPTMRFADVSFAWDEVRTEFSRAELEQMRDDYDEKMPAGDEKTATLAQMAEEIAGAYEEPSEGKAPPPVAD
ncbi:hypothetical protein [Kitasatospora sp. NPDC056184]|uniref:hypothetical protein n=1 Tax=Kitasatospora sp. NPDC056184 TaxID=3345738 RepID=UPI0035DCEA83